MKITFSWLKELLNTDLSIEKISSCLFHLGHEVESITDRRIDLSDFIIVQIKEVLPHPDANKLNLCIIDNGREELQVVCGASNVKKYGKVVFAPVGSIIPNGKFKIKPAIIRGQKSSGMICSASELLIGKDNDGIIELPSNAPIGTRFVEYSGLDDPVIDIAITPNRGDCISVYGIARDLAAKSVGTISRITETSLFNNYQDSNLSCTIQEKDICNKISFIQVRNINNAAIIPEYISRRLISVGIGLVNPVVDIANYIVHTFGQPLHVYDKDKISGNLKIGFSEENNVFEGLDKKKYTLLNSDILVKDDREILCIAGILGGLSSSCSDTTTNILIEAGSFNSTYIGKTAERLRINTDAKYRFERKVTGYNIDFVLDYTSKLISEILGGEILDYCSQGILSDNKIIEFEYKRVKEILSLDITIDEIKNILSSIEISIERENENTLSLSIPLYRPDILEEEDILEEIARIYGFDGIAEEALPLQISNFGAPYIDFKQILATYGFNEQITWSFTSAKDIKFFSEYNESLEIASPISKDLNYLRPTALPNLLSIINFNINRSIDSQAYFEIGPNFSVSGHTILEQNVLTAIAAGYANGLSPYSVRREYDFFDIKAALKYMFDALGLNFESLNFVPNATKYYHPYKSASILLGKNVIGYIGYVHPQILKEYDIPIPVIASEIWLEKLPGSKLKIKKEFIPNCYQSVTRDFSFIFDIHERMGDVVKFISNLDGLINSVEIFDIYKGPSLPKDKKSVSFSIKINPKEATMDYNSLEKFQEMVISSVQSKFNTVLRYG